MTACSIRVREELLTRRRGFVVQGDCSVLVEGQALPGSGVAVQDAVADDDSGVTETVVVTVDGENGTVISGDVGGGLNDVEAELILGESRA